MSLTKTVKNNTFDDCFTEVDHTESISTIRPGSMRLFYLNVRSGKIKISDLEKFTMLNIGRYVFQERSRNNMRKPVILMRLCSRRSGSCVNAEPLVPREPEMSLER